MRNLARADSSDINSPQAVQCHRLALDDSLDAFDALPEWGSYGSSIHNINRRFNGKA